METPTHLRALLIENEADIARLITYSLRNDGYIVTPAYDVTEADAKLAGGTYDVILLDLMLPGEDGYTYCRRLKSRENTRDIPVIIVSARVMPDEINKAYAAGADYYITKPYDPISLGRQIRDAVEKKRASGPSAPLP